MRRPATLPALAIALLVAGVHGEEAAPGDESPPTEESAPSAESPPSAESAPSAEAEKVPSTSQTGDQREDASLNAIGNRESEDQEAESPEAEFPNTDEDANADAEPEGQNGPAQPAQEIFTPSEEISEDLAVPFPVDI